MNIFLRAPYNYDVVSASDESSLNCPEPTLTVQDKADECDINYIVRKFGITGELPVALHAPTYGDFVGISNYQDALHAINAADDAFMAMPANVRSRFDNDPAKFVDFCSDPENKDEMSKLGLLDPSVKVPASPAPAADGGQGEAAPVPPAPPA